MTKGVIEESRNNVALMINCNQDEIYFTSGGTEANNWIIYSSLFNYRLHWSSLGKLPPHAHIISSNIEHDSIRLLLEHLSLENDKKIEVSWIKVSKETGTIQADDVINAIKPNTILITIMSANNETGYLQDLKSITNRLQEVNQERASKNLPTIYCHTDAAQAIGKIKVDVNNLKVDYLTIAGHKVISNIYMF